MFKDKILCFSFFLLVVVNASRSNRDEVKIALSLELPSEKTSKLAPKIMVHLLT